MSDSSPIADGGMPWLDATGAEPHLVVSTRIRLARNLEGRAFWGRNTANDREAVFTDVVAAARDAAGLVGATVHRLDTASVPLRRWLTERQLISRELAALDANGRVRSGAALLLGRGTSALVNEEDHLRLQGLRSGFALDAAYRLTDRVDTELGVRLRFAFHSGFGYLTACPTNVGTGLRASVLIHLPALVLSKEITKVLHGLAQVGLTYRGLFGEGSDALGDLFQLSNQTTLGKSEPELLDHLGRMVRQVMAYEESARGALFRDARVAIEDRSWRAWATLRHARLLSFGETAGLLSAIRMGVGMHLLPPVPWRQLNRMLVLSQRAHVAVAAGIEADDETLPERRAALVRQTFETMDRTGPDDGRDSGPAKERAG